MENRKIEIFTLGQSISKMGDRIYSFILPMLYAYYFMNPYAATVISGSYSVGGIIGSSIGIKFSDKLNYKKWPIFLNFLQAFIVFLMTYLLSFEKSSMYIYGSMSFLLGISLSFLQSFNGKYIYSLGTKKMLKKIAGIRVAGDNLGVAVGALLSGIVIAYKAFSVATLINAITFLISAIVMIILNRRLEVNADNSGDVKDRKITSSSNIDGDLKKQIGLKIAFLLVFNFMICIFTQPSVYILTNSLLEISQDWKASFLISASGVFSAIIGYIIYKSNSVYMKKNYGLFFAWIIFSIAFLFVPHINSKILIVMIGGIWALSQTVYSVDFEATIIEMSDENSRGRLFSNIRLSRQLANPIGFALAGFLISNLGGMKALNIMMCALIVTCILAYRAYNIINSIKKEKGLLQTYEK